MRNAGRMMVIALSCSLVLLPCLADQEVETVIPSITIGEVVLERIDGALAGASQLTSVGEIKMELSPLAELPAEVQRLEAHWYLTNNMSEAVTFTVEALQVGSVRVSLSSVSDGQLTFDFDLVSHQISNISDTLDYQSFASSSLVAAGRELTDAATVATLLKSTPVDVRDSASLIAGLSQSVFRDLAEKINSQYEDECARNSQTHVGCRDCCTNRYNNQSAICALAAGVCGVIGLIGAGWLSIVGAAACSAACLYTAGRVWKSCTRDCDGHYNVTPEN